MPAICRREKLRQELLELQRNRSDLEKEILSLHEVLKTQNVGLDEPLVDKEGFPRSDIDVYQVRFARNKIIRLTNDCKNITSEMERKLHELHAMDRNSSNPEISPFRDVGSNGTFL